VESCKKVCVLVHILLLSRRRILCFQLLLLGTHTRRKLEETGNIGNKRNEKKEKVAQEEIGI